MTTHPLSDFLEVIDTDHFTHAVARKTCEALGREITLVVGRPDLGTIEEAASSLRAKREELFTRSLNHPPIASPFEIVISYIDVCFEMLRHVPLLERPMATFLAEQRHIDLLRKLDQHGELERAMHDITDPVRDGLTNNGLATIDGTFVRATPKVKPTLKLHQLQNDIAKAWTDFESAE